MGFRKLTEQEKRERDKNKIVSSRKTQTNSVDELQLISVMEDVFLDLSIKVENKLSHAHLLSGVRKGLPYSVCVADSLYEGICAEVDHNQKNFTLIEVVKFAKIVQSTSLGDKYVKKVPDTTFGVWEYGSKDKSSSVLKCIRKVPFKRFTSTQYDSVDLDITRLISLVKHNLGHVKDESKLLMLINRFIDDNY